MLLFYLSNTAAENPPFLVNLLLPSPIELAFVVHWKSPFFLTKETVGEGEKVIIFAKNEQQALRYTSQHHTTKMIAVTPPHPPGSSQVLSRAQRTPVHFFLLCIGLCAIWFVRGPTHITQTDVWVSRGDKLSLFKRRGFLL